MFSWVVDIVTLPQKAAGQQSEEVKTGAKYDMVQQTPHPCLSWIGRLRCSQSQSEGRLHDQEGRQDRASSEEDRGKRCWMPEPAVARAGHKGSGECDADPVMGDPSCCAFCALRRSGAKIRMAERSFRHISEPAPDETEAGGRHTESPFEKQGPEIRCERGAKSHEDDAHEGESCRVHESPVG